MIVALVSAAILFFILYIVFSLPLYKQKEGRKFNFKNTFAYEIFLSKKKEYFYVNILFFLFLGLSLSSVIVLTITNYDPTKLASCILGIVCVCMMGVTSIVPLSKYKEHMVCSILFMILTALWLAVNMFFEIRLYKIENKPLYLLPIILDAILMMTDFVCVLNPQVTNLNLSRDNENNLIRPKTITLSITEWIITFSFILGLVSQLIVSIA